MVDVNPSKPSKPKLPPAPIGEELDDDPELALAIALSQEDAASSAVDVNPSKTKLPPAPVGEELDDDAELAMAIALSLGGEVRN